MKRKVTQAMREKYWGKRTAQQWARTYPGLKRKLQQGGEHDLSPA